MPDEINKNNTWEILSKKIPLVVVFILASIFIFKFSDEKIIGWIFAVVAISHSFLIVRIDHYEKIIKQKDSQLIAKIDHYEKIIKQKDSQIKSYGDIEKITTSHIKDTLHSNNKNNSSFDETRTN